MRGNWCHKVLAIAINVISGLKMASARYETVNTKSFKMFFRDIKTSIRIIHAFWACGKKSIWTKIYLVKAHIESWTNKGVGCFFEVKSKWWTSQAILYQKTEDRKKIKQILWGWIITWPSEDLFQFVSWKISSMSDSKISSFCLATKT